MLERRSSLVLFALDLEDEKRGDAMVSGVKSRGPMSPLPEVHFPDGKMEKREFDLPGRYDLHYVEAGDTKRKRESLLLFPKRFWSFWPGHDNVSTPDSISTCRIVLRDSPVPVTSIALTRQIEFVLKTALREKCSWIKRFPGEQTPSISTTFRGANYEKYRRIASGDTIVL